jgi:hypothetical protein
VPRLLFKHFLVNPSSRDFGPAEPPVSKLNSLPPPPGVPDLAPNPVNTAGAVFFMEDTRAPLVKV